MLAILERDLSLISRALRRSPSEPGYKSNAAASGFCAIRGGWPKSAAYASLAKMQRLIQHVISIDEELPYAHHSHH